LKGCANIRLPSAIAVKQETRFYIALDITNRLTKIVRSDFNKKEHFDFVTLFVSFVMTSVSSDIYTLKYKAAMSIIFGTHENYREETCCPYACFGIFSTAIL